ncbi:binding-protein-dependent transport systems inner membrane component [Bacillus sp. OxB-1]|nr:binding-protein-dependent transport systems inner membrane component [Bacillus sp. OxB-1]
MNVSPKTFNDAAATPVGTGVLSNVNVTTCPAFRLPIAVLFTVAVAGVCNGEFARRSASNT